MDVCINAKKRVLSPTKNKIMYGPVHRAEFVTSNLIWPLLREFEDEYPDFDACEYSIQVIDE